MKYYILFLFIYKFTFSYINIHPIFFDKRIDNSGSYQEFTLINELNEPIMYRVYTEEYSKNPSISMHKWINFYPRSLTLNPGEKGKIKISVASHSNLPHGEYSAILGIREIPIFNTKESSMLSMYTDLKLQLNGYAGNIYPELIFKNLKLKDTLKKVYLQGSVFNDGKRRGKFELYLDNNFIGNLRIHTNETLNLKDLNFYYNKNKNFKIPNFLIIKDYITKKEIKKIKLK